MTRTQLQPVQLYLIVAAVLLGGLGFEWWLIGALG